jgi:hypothetical protein
MLLVPFNVTMPEDRQDRQLIQKLEQELPGIFNWSIEGPRRLSANMSRHDLAEEEQGQVLLPCLRFGRDGRQAPRAGEPDHSSQRESTRVLAGSCNALSGCRRGRSAHPTTRDRVRQGDRSLRCPIAIASPRRLCGMSGCRRDGTELDVFLKQCCLTLTMPLGAADSPA